MLLTSARTLHVQRLLSIVLRRLSIHSGLRFANTIYRPPFRHLAMLLFFTSNTAVTDSYCRLFVVASFIKLSRCLQHVLVACRYVLICLLCADRRIQGKVRQAPPLLLSARRTVVQDFIKFINSFLCCIRSFVL